ncbi:MAG: hypothetical protein IJ779_02945 [Ruminococcus sp.]|nr:hypothetical protein [Ruminococcus sp.]
MLNVVVSCLVICFSYGLYQSYNVVIEKGKNTAYKDISIKAAAGTSHSSEKYSSDYLEVFESEITVGEFTDMLSSFSDDLADNIAQINLYLGFYNDVYCTVENGELISDTGIYESFFHVSAKDHSVVCAGIDEGTISDEDYASGERIVVVGDELFDPDHGHSINQSKARLLTDEKYITIEGEKYELRRISGNLDGRLVVPLTALTRDMKIWVQPYMGLMDISFNEPLTMSQYNEFSAAAAMYLGERATLPKLEFAPAEELYYYRTILLISVVIAILAAINMAVLYRYILERRSRDLAVFRLCGCTGGKAVMIYMGEALVLSLPLFAFSEFLWHRLLMPRFAGLFEHFENAYSFKLYAAVFGIYAASVAAVMLLMIYFVVRRHSLIELKTKGKGRAFGVFRVLEIVQLSAVLVLCLAVSFACLSRYELYSPFKDKLESKGYAVNYQGPFMYADDFRQSMKGADVSATCWINFVTEGYDVNSDEDSMYQTIAYDEDLIDRFTPKLSGGTWLNKTEHSYRSDKTIPAVVSPGSGFSVGDRFISPDNMIEWDENYEPTRVEDLCFIVVGKLEESASVFSYPYLMSKYTDHRDLYGVYNTEFVDTDMMFIRERDIRDLYGFDAPVMGTQLVDCKDLSDEEYKEVGSAIKRMNGTQYISFEEINKASKEYIFEQLKTVFPIAVCIFILTLISSISISAIYTKRQMHTYAILYICGSTWRGCAFRSLRSGLITCGLSAALTVLTIIVGRQTFMKETVISFGLIPLAVCAEVLIVYLTLSMIMPLLIIGRTEPREILKEE